MKAGYSTQAHETGLAFSQTETKYEGKRQDIEYWFGLFWRQEKT